MWVRPFAPYSGYHGTEELGEPIVVRAKDRGHQRRILHPEVEQALRRVEDLACDSVEPHVREMLLGVVSAPRHVLQPRAAGNRFRSLEPCAGVQDEPDAGKDLV